MTRRILIPAILSLAAAGSVLTGTAVTLAAAPAVVAAAPAHAHAHPGLVFDG